jgi:hypothetical protein
MSRKLKLLAGDTINYIDLELTWWIDAYDEDSGKFPYKIRFRGADGGNSQTIGWKKEKDRDNYLEKLEKLLHPVTLEDDEEEEEAVVPEPKIPETPKEDVLASDYDPMEAIK